MKGKVMIKSIVVVACAGFVMGCSMTAPQYTPSVANIGQLKTAKLKPLAVEKVVPDTALGSNNESIGLRASSMNSPTGSYSTYIEEAIKSEFQAAGLLDPASSTKLSGVLVKNDVNVGGFSTGDSIIEARVKVTKAGTVAYDKLKTATLQFESSFAGPVAIPKGRDMYPVTVQKFIETLISDSDFVSALK